MKKVFSYDTPLGRIGIAEENSFITNLYFEEDIPFIENCTFGETAVLREAGRQMEEYFQGERREFRLRLLPEGTEFMRSVWEELSRIPYGETRSYKDIAQNIGSPLAFRAVGQANNRNPVPIFIPCHRVIGSKGQLVGYGGGLGRKEYLLKLEKSNILREYGGIS